MNQAAQTAKRSLDFAATYSSIAKRRGKKIATIAISRKLLGPGHMVMAAARTQARRRMGACETTPPATRREPARDP
jgi:hypothetical protein